MFGFFAPHQHIPEWRRSYARICQYQRKLFGLTSLPFLSYEAAFLYQVAIDLTLIPQLSASAPECCRLRRLVTSVSADEDAAARYAAAFGLVLTGVKLKDDVQDSGRLLNRLLEWKFRRPVKLAESLIAATAPDVINRINQAVRQHSDLEHSGHRLPLDQYAQPTGDGFAFAFEGIASGLQCSASVDRADQMMSIGRRVGQAIIAWDCAVDFDRDRITGNYNPLPDESAIRHAFHYCLLQLAEIGWSLPENSASRAVVAGVAARVRYRGLRPAAQHPLRLLERWGLVRERGFAYARCDGCEGLCEVGACCECIGGAGEAAGGCGECCNTPNVCLCDPGCCDICFWRKNSTGATRANQLVEDHDQTGSSDQTQQSVSPYVHLQGSHGVADSSLNPSGYATIEDQRVPVRSQSGMFIEAGSSIRVVQTDLFGVTVVAED